MQTELAPVRRAQQLLQAGETVDRVVDDLRRGFGITVAEALASVAEYVALMKGGKTVPEEPFARPYV